MAENFPFKSVNESIQSTARSTRKGKVRFTLQDVLRSVWSVFVGRHKLSKLDSRPELRIQEVVFVEQQHKCRFFQELVQTQRLPQQERVPLWIPKPKPMMNDARLEARNATRTSRLTLRSSVSVWLNAETGAMNKSIFTFHQRSAPWVNALCHTAFEHKRV